MVKEIQTKAEYDEALASNDIVVIDFSATWCGPCKMIGPKFEAMSQEAQFSKIKCFKVDVDEVSDLNEDCNVVSLPTFIVFKAGKEANRMIGANEAKLRETLTKALE